MGRDELERLREVIGLPDADDAPAWVPRRHAPSNGLTDAHDAGAIIDLTDAPVSATDYGRRYLAEIVEEIDRKLDKLVHGAPALPGHALDQDIRELRYEVDDMRHRVEQLQTSLDALTRSLLGHR